MRNDSFADRQVQDSGDGRVGRRHSGCLQLLRHTEPDGRRGTPAPNTTQAPATPVPATTPKPVTITVASLLPGSTQSAFDAFNLRVDEFEAQYPWITVQGQEYQWLATTFTAQLAAGTLPDVFTIPFTDGKG